ncbi:MAG TPA: hypothetical protein V6D17_11340 [Candidatus Obscuribacterales bacterium]
MSNYDNNPLGGRGKAAEEAWAHEENRRAIEKLKEKEKKEKKGKEGDGKDSSKTDPATAGADHNPEK